MRNLGKPHRELCQGKVIYITKQKKKLKISFHSKFQIKVIVIIIILYSHKLKHEYLIKYIHLSLDYA